MTVEEAEKCGGCLVQISKRDYSFGGVVCMLWKSWREFISDGTINYGVTLRNVFDGGNIEHRANYIEMIPYAYPDAVYESTPAQLSLKEIYALGGKIVEYEGRGVYLRRLNKEYRDDRHWRYTLLLQEAEYPNRVFDAELQEIRRYNGRTE